MEEDAEKDAEEDAEEDAEKQRGHGERRSEGNRGTSDTLLIRDRRSPLHSRCTAGDSPRLLLARRPRAGFLSRLLTAGLHPAYAISHSGGLVFFLRGGEQKEGFFADRDSLGRKDQSAVPNASACA